MGTLDRAYVERKNSNNRACRYDSACKKTRGYYTAKKPEKKIEKKGIFAGFAHWQNIARGDFRGAWNRTLGSADWWRHKGIDIALGIVAATGAAFCIASGVCMMGLVLVAGAALITTGVAAHLAVATEEERRQGGAQFLLPSALAVGKGAAFGATWGRGVVGAISKGAYPGRHGPRREVTFEQKGSSPEEILLPTLPVEGAT